MSSFRLVSTGSGFVVYNAFWAEPHDERGPASGPIVDLSAALAVPATPFGRSSMAAHDGTVMFAFVRALADGTWALEAVLLDAGAHPVGASRTLFSSDAELASLELLWAGYSYLAVFTRESTVYALRVCQ